jgi:PAS domain S-box-containing protein
MRSWSHHPRLSSIRVRLVFLVLLAVIPALGLILYTAAAQRRSAAINAQENLLRLVKVAAANQRQASFGARQLLIALAQMPEIRGGNREKCNLLLANLLKQYRVYAGFGVVDGAGNSICSAPLATQPVNTADRAYFRLAKETRDFAIGEYQIGRVTGKATLNFGYPILDQAGQVLAVVLAALDLAWLDQLAAEMKLPEGSVVTVTDRKGTILVRYPDSQNWVGKSVPNAPMTKKVLSQKEGTTEAISLDGVERLYAFTTLESGTVAPDVHVRIGVPKTVAFAEANRLLVQNLLGLGTVTVLALTAGWVGGDVFVTRKVKSLVQTTRKLQGGDLNARTDLSYESGELGQLAYAFDEMAAALKAREQAIAALNQDLQTLFEVIPIGVLLAQDPEFKLVKSNPAFAQILGLAPDANVSYTPADAPRPSYKLLKDGRELTPNEFPLRYAAIHKTEIKGTEVDIVRGDGNVFNLFGYAKPLLNEQEQVRGSVAAFLDITERKRVEETLRRTNQRLQTLIDACPVAIAFFDPQGIVKLWNRAAEKIFGWSAEEAIGQFMPTVPHRPQEFLTSIQTVLSGRSLNGLEAQHQCKDGHMVDLEIWANLTHDAEGNPGCLGIAWDITERKQAEAALIAQEQRYRYIFEAVSVAIWEEDFSQVKAAINKLKKAGIDDFQQYFVDHPEFVQKAADMVQIRDVNQAALRMFGAQDKSELLTSLHQIFVPETEEAFIGELLAIAAEETFFAAETVLRTVGGDRVHVWLTISFPSTSESYNRVLVSLLDISDRRRTQEALRRSEERLRISQELSLDAFTILDSIRDETGEIIDFVWTYVNPKAAEILQRPVQELIGKRLLEVLPAHQTNSELFERYVRVVETGVAHDIELSHNTNGVMGWLRNMAVKLEDGVAISFSDITPRKRAEAEREQLLAREQAAREQAEAANRIKDEFLAVLSHELRSPLNPILGWSKLLQTGKLDALSSQRALETIERNAKLQTQLIEDLLDVSRILRGKMALNICAVNLVTIIESALETVLLAAEAKHIQIQTVITLDNAQVCGDSARLQQIVWNLLSNAIKFTADGGKVEIRLDQIDTYAQIQVKDTGKGISPDFLPYVFDYFRQEDGKITRKFGGLGLGLAIVRHLSELHGGTVYAESLGEGQGAAFTVRLPLMALATASEPEISTTAQSVDLSQLRILVVDDEEDMRDLVQFILEQQGAQVTVAASAAEALMLFERQPPDILISDIGMPEMDGYMLMQQIRRRSSQQGGQILAIALTAYAGEYDQRQALKVGFQKHIPKPVEPEVLVNAISELIISERSI